MSDWSEWKQQDTGPAAKVEIRKDLAETDPDKEAPAAPALSEAASKAGVLVLGTGEPMSAVKYEGPMERIPLEGYEISWDGMRVDGNDFFCALTFPVGKPDRCVTLVTGGWEAGPSASARSIMPLPTKTKRRAAMNSKRAAGTASRCR